MRGVFLTASHEHPLSISEEAEDAIETTLGAIQTLENRPLAYAKYIILCVRAMQWYHLCFLEQDAQSVWVLVC